MKKIHETRRVRLEKLIAKKGGLGSFCAETKISQSRLWPYRTGTRGFTESFAREVEAKAGERLGWLDGHCLSTDGMDTELLEMIRLAIRLTQAYILENNLKIKPEQYEKIVIYILDAFQQVKKEQSLLKEEDMTERVIHIIKAFTV